MLLSIPPKRIELLKKLKQTHKLFLLSNTNSIHFNTIEELLISTHNTSFNELFDTVFLSYEMKLRKPDDEIYQEVKKHIYKNQKAIFFDDNYDNITQSKHNGIEAILVDKDITEIIKNEH